LEDLEDLVALHSRMIDAVAVDQIAAVEHRVADLVDRDRRCDLAGGVSAHPVGDQEQPKLLVDEEVVLVVRALPTDISRRGERQLHLLRVTRAGLTVKPAPRVIVLFWASAGEIRAPPARARLRPAPGSGSGRSARRRSGRRSRWPRC